MNERSGGRIFKTRILDPDGTLTVYLDDPGSKRLYKEQYDPRLNLFSRDTISYLRKVRKPRPRPDLKQHEDPLPRHAADAVYQMAFPDPPDELDPPDRESVDIDDLFKSDELFSEDASVFDFEF
jgi:hypothetical protein